MSTRKIASGTHIRFHTGDGMMRDGTLLKTVDGIGYSILPDEGRRLLVPAENVKGAPVRR